MIHKVISCSRARGREHENNIGDYVQGIAANQFMRTDQYIERERLDEYTGEEAKVIMNGWFMDCPEKFPPSNRIKPLFVSFHLRPSIAEKFLTADVVKYLNEHGPIGCRDEGTREILESHGVGSYFSGCLTLTLGNRYKRPPEHETKGICFVDPFIAFKGNSFLRGLHWYLIHPILVVKVYRLVSRQMLQHKPLMPRLRIVLKIGVFLRSFSKVFSKEALVNAQYLSHVVNAKLFQTAEEQLAYADNLLRKYAASRLCVTSRIHCALPCLGIGTPVIFLNSVGDELSDGRFKGLLDLFNTAVAVPKGLKLNFQFSSQRDDGLIDENAVIKNKDDFKPLAAALSDVCSRFAHLEN